MFSTKTKRPGSSFERGAGRFAPSLLVLVASTAAAFAGEPPGSVLGDDVGTLPAVWDPGPGTVWEPGSTVDAGTGLKDETPTWHPLQAPALALRGAPDAVHDAILSAAPAAGGSGYAVVELLATGEQRVSFHGDVAVAIDPAALASGAVRAELLVSDLFGPAQAAVEWGGHWSPLFVLGGGELAVPTRVALGQGVQFAAVGALGESYRLTLEPGPGVLRATQGEL